jgi:hypothetical protein
MRALKHRIIVVLIGLNLLGALTLVPIMRSGTALIKVMLTDVCTELRYQGILDEKALREHYGARVDPDNVESLARFFLLGGLKMPVSVAWGVSVLLVANCLLLFWIKRTL